MLDDFDDSVLGDPISYARFRIPIVTAGICLAAEFGLLDGLGGRLDCVGARVVRAADGGDLGS